MNLHVFDISHSFLDSIGIKRLDEYEDNVFIGTKDFTEEERKGNIEWGNDGVYLKINGNLQRGFMYIKTPDIDRYGLPTFHLFKCDTIQRYIEQGWFDGHYFWSNSEKVDLRQRRTNVLHENKKLNLCGNCRSILSERNLELIRNTEDFHNSLDLNEIQDDEIEPTDKVDIFGRPFNWQKISTAYKKTVNYTCESCGFGGSDLESNYDKRFIDTDHVTGWDLTNTDNSNLMCLCKLCHAYKDDTHTENFNKRRMKIELKTFVNKYRHILEIKNPRLLIRFDRDNG